MEDLFGDLIPKDDENTPAGLFDDLIPAPTPTQTQPVQAPVTATVPERDPLIPSGDTDTRSTEQFVQETQPTPVVPQTGFRPFTTDVYDDAETFADAVRTYNEFYDDPNTERPFLGLGYATQTNPETGERFTITPPSPRLFGGASTGFGDLAIAGSRDAIGNAIELAGSIVEKLGVEGATDFTRDNIVNPLFPALNTGESGMDALIAEGVPILASSLVGAGLALRATQGANLLIRGGAAALGGEVGATAASGNDAGSIFIGENAMLPILQGVDLEDGTANDVIEARLNLLADGLMSGGIVGGAVVTGAKAARLAYGVAIEPLVNVAIRGDKGIEDTAINSVLRQLTDEVSGLSAADLADPNVRFQAGERIRELIEQNESVLVPYLNQLDENLPVNLDSMTALIRGLDGSQDANLISRAEGLRSGTIQSGGGRTLDQVNQPVRTLDQQTGEFLREVGGETPAEQTDTMFRGADTLAESGRREVVDAQAGLQSAQQAYERSATELVADLANDVELSDEIRRLSRATGTEIDTSRTASREQIRGQIETAYSNMRNTKNSLYGAIEGGPIDTGALYDVLSSVRLDELSRQATSLQRTSPLREIAELFQPRMVPDSTPSGAVDLTIGEVPGSQAMRQETRDEVVQRVNDWFARDPDMYNFGFFQNIIRPELSTLASDLFARNESRSGGIVRQIVKTIDDDMVDFVARTDPNLADAAVEAKRYYADEFAPLFRDGRLAEFSELYDSTVARDIRPVDFTSGSRNIVDSTIRSGDEAQIGQFRDLLSRSEAGGDPSPLASYMVADTISNAADALRTSGGTEAQLGGFIGQIRQYSESLNELFPAQAVELNDFIRRVEATQGNRVELQRVMDEAQTTLRQTMDDVQNGELSAFFRRDFGDVDNPLLKNLATASDPQAAFRSVLLSNKNDTTAVVRALVDRANALPDAERGVVMDGMQTAYTRLFRDQVLGRRREQAGVRPASPAKIELGLEEVQSLFRVGDEVFRDAPEFMDAMRTMSELAGITASSRNATPISAMSATEFNRQATTATNRLIYTFIGPLTRTGTRLRAFASTALETLAPDERAKVIMDKIMADPQYFSELARRYNRQPGNQEAQEVLLRAILPAGVRPTTDEESDESWLDTAIDIETQMRDALQ